MIGAAEDAVARTTTTHSAQRPTAEEGHMVPWRTAESEVWTFTAPFWERLGRMTEGSSLMERQNLVLIEFLISFFLV